MMKPTALRKHYRSSSSSGEERFYSFLHAFPHPSGATAADGGVEFNEAEVCFARESSNPPRTTHLLSSSPTTTAVPNNRSRPLSRQIQNPGLLAALHAATPAKQIPASRSHEKGSSHQAPRSKFQQSAPVNVPITATRGKNHFLDDDVEQDDEEMLPPHEIVARRGINSMRNTCSVLEGAGRTLKGRDLRQVRNAIWQRTGFLD
ncbi:hypothetical protein SAY86_018509 [Trapa natans]|uniref:Senescence regulator n=1 Tax=Trapa natans TaxID=22666 RepID=A0AAN7R1S8_TRANT|nr:hypothetical protein SAY86_018509 [Trapa natans]